ncbi:39S ribosomal protein S30, mitochondrial [Cimex lectularius]|uniref:28S ribosomal protein S30, mitochondrial n=1 Tax=Cimex lectularius TaxID=79782 RepID=A0A8I6RPU2_CIMLE|nr:39S ribosomal protein S30, mitochondrial [Cimex lectularius]
MKIVRKFSFILRRNYCSTSLIETNEAKYPPILDLSPEAVKVRERQEKAKNIEVMNTVEEKLFAINLDKYYGWNSLILTEGVYPYKFMPFAKHVTRTYVHEVSREEFHNIQKTVVDENKELVERIRPYLQEALLLELNCKKKKIDVESEFFKSQSDINNEASRPILESINQILLSSLSTQYPHLLETMVDYNPRVEAFWLVGNFQPSQQLIDEREKFNKDNEGERNVQLLNTTELVEHWVQYFGKPLLQLRATLPLQVLDTERIPEYNQNKEPNVLVPKMDHDPSLSYNLNFQRRFGTNIPGFWPGDKHEFGILSYHQQGHVVDRPPHFGEKELKETLQAQAVLAGFSWTHAQACYQGFSTYSDVTYPFVSQHILSDGRNFSFYLYQLNTTLLHSDFTEKNPRLNVCVALPSSQLYQEIKGNEFVGWDDSVLSTLISCYLNQPQVRSGVDLKPFLNPAEQKLAEIEDEERRKWLHKQFKHMYSNRPRHKLPYEIYDWERIYKIKFNTRMLEARNRPFERGQNPLEERKYYEHMHEYIPKKFRPKKRHWMGWRAKFAKTYYPEKF